MEPKPALRKEELEKLSDLVLEKGYILERGAIALLHEMISESAVQGPEKVLLRALFRGRADLGVDEVRENLVSFAQAVLDNPDARRRLERMTLPSGVIPKASKAFLRRLLEPVKVQANRFLPSPSSNTHGEQVVLDLSGSHWPLQDLPRLLTALAGVPSGFSSIKIRLGDFTYSSALAVLAEWLLSRESIDRYVIECPDDMHEYLKRVRFTPQELRNPDVKISPNPFDWAIGLTRINATVPTDIVVGKVVEIIDTFTNLGAAERSALLVLISEVIENVHRHASASLDGFAVANVYPKRLKMGITFVDSGIGITNSLKLPGAFGAPPSVSSEFDYLKAACTLSVTSKPDRHSGYGLYLLEQVVARNRGTLVLSSGGTSMFSYQRAGGRLARDPYNHGEWKGTVVTMILNLHEKLPLRDVYETIPPSPFVIEGDVFDD